MLLLLGLSLLLLTGSVSTQQQTPQPYEEVEAPAEDLPEFAYTPLGELVRTEKNYFSALLVDSAWDKESDLVEDLPDLNDEVYQEKPPPDADARQSPGSVLPCGTSQLSVGYYWLQSPHYPGDYPNNYNCAYRLYPPNGGALTFRCYSFSLESSTSCANDYLQVFNTRYCGTSAPTPRYDYFYLRLNFRTNGDVSSSGYRCLVQAKQQGYGYGGLRCGTHRVRPGTYTIRSHNYPQNYASLRFCRWFLYGYSQTDKFTTTCTRFNMESHSSCLYDYLNVNGRRYCGTTAPSTTRSYYTYAAFSTDYSVTRSGFSCTIRVTASCSCRCGTRNRRARIVGGQNATSGEYPWMAGLVSPGSTRTFCGGSLINNRYVLTAAHCTVGRTPSTLQVLLGDHEIGVSDGESRHTLSNITMHHLYQSISGGWDFSLLRLSSPVTFTSRRRPICLPTAGRTYAGVTAIATGFGRTAAGAPQATILQEVSLGVISEAQCRQRWSFINTSHICAGGVGGRAVCNGDSGGPLIAYENGHYVLIGVVSFGRPCAFVGYPDGYGRVTAALKWIRANTGDATYCT